MRCCIVRCRGRVVTELWTGDPCYASRERALGATPRFHNMYSDLRYMRPQRPIRALGLTQVLPPILYNRLDQITQIENALALQRVERQVSVTLSQLALGIRNAENFIEKHLLQQEQRPSLYSIWFHENSLREHAHVLSTLAAHHLVPLYSLLGYDVQNGKMSVHEAEELYNELMDCAVAQPSIAQRELANQMVRVHCLNDDYDKAVEVIDEMAVRRIRRTFVTYAPLFRYLRGRVDAEGQVRLLQHMYEIEGGRVGKWVFIDIPRLFYMWGVFIRYNWAIINFCFTCAATLAFITLLDYSPSVE